MNEYQRSKSDWKCIPVPGQSWIPARDAEIDIGIAYLKKGKLYVGLTDMPVLGFLARGIVLLHFVTSYVSLSEETSPSVFLLT